MKTNNIQNCPLQKLMGANSTSGDDLQFDLQVNFQCHLQIMNFDENGINLK